MGDWLVPNKHFPHGVELLAEMIRDEGLTPGLWLAPFILHPSANIARSHPEWLLRNKYGAPVRTGFVWNSLGAALDLTHPGAIEHVREVIRTAAYDWGFPYLKLDFLYAAALKGVYQDRTKTRAQVLRYGMEVIRESASPETTMLGCGAPLGSMLGMVQAMRIGADVSGFWKPSFHGIALPFKNERCMPSARNSIQNILTRSAINNCWWVNDPDCLLVRLDSNLSLPEVQSLATAIAVTGGSVYVSDDMTKLPDERIRIAASLLPPINQRPWVLDWLEEGMPIKLQLDLEGSAGCWHLLACFNWSDSEVLAELHKSDFHLDDCDYLVRSFWQQNVWRSKTGCNLFNGVIQSHGVLLMAVRKCFPNLDAYLGSDMHISQGLEVSSWKLGSNSLNFEISSGKKMNGIVDLGLRKRPKAALANLQKALLKDLGNNIFRLPLPEAELFNIRIEF